MLKRYALRYAKGSQTFKPSSETSEFGSTRSKLLPRTFRASRKKSITSLQRVGAIEKHLGIHHNVAD